MATLTSPSNAYAGNGAVNAVALSPAQNVLTLVGRILIALLFVPSGFGKIMGFSGVVGYIAAHGAPLPEVCAVIAIFCEFVLGLCVLFGFQTRWAALGLGLFTLVISPIFHNFWGVPDAQVAMQKVNFFKNMAIAGGLFAFASFGPGAFSLDAKRR